MTYDEFTSAQSFTLEELIGFAYGRLVDDPPRHFDARLPAPPFLMVDRITSVTTEGKGGLITAEHDIRLDDWYFQCHMPGDPVMPGCLYLDGIWQLLGFYCVWRRGLGSGRALGCDEVSFNGQVRPFNRMIRYEIRVRRFSHLSGSGSSIVIADGDLSVDGETVMTVRGARTGLFKDIAYRDYPRQSRHAVGGMIKERI
ncbi:MAG TPA: bifunctional 3-hydroxydecanoyl-ACP dehydratase/trans-2-decenoyl-ACP isomerase [Deltaproteobacteria bacterium]|nr:bifunctional 3-hydroxydecanoyl-ACP dehydratase/trans-2-decenoyl-ACP isomerase [Deltaproteobacteria bacterium]